MKKLNQKQKNGLLIGGGILAVLAFSSFNSNGGSAENPKIIIIGFDPEAMRVHYTLNGENRSAPVSGSQAFPLGGGYGIKTERAVYGIMKILHTLNNKVISELAQADVSQYHYEAPYAPPTAGGGGKKY